MVEHKLSLEFKQKNKHLSLHLITHLQQASYHDYHILENVLPDTLKTLPIKSFRHVQMENHQLECTKANEEKNFEGKSIKDNVSIEMNEDSMEKDNYEEKNENEVEDNGEEKDNEEKGNGDVEEGNEETGNGDEKDNEETSNGDEKDNEETSNGDEKDDEETSNGDEKDDEETSNGDEKDEETSNGDEKDDEETGNGDKEEDNKKETGYGEEEEDDEETSNDDKDEDNKEEAGDEEEDNEDEEEDNKKETGDEEEDNEETGNEDNKEEAGNGDEEQEGNEDEDNDDEEGNGDEEEHEKRDEEKTSNGEDETKKIVIGKDKGDKAMRKIDKTAVESSSEWENPDEDSPVWDSPEWSLEEESPEKESSKAYEEMCAEKFSGHSGCSIKESIPENSSCPILKSPQKVDTPFATDTDQSNIDKQILTTIQFWLDSNNITSVNWQEELIKNVSILPKRQLPVDPKTVKVNLPEKKVKLKQNPEYEMPSPYQLEVRCLNSLKKIRSICNRDISCKSKVPTENLVEKSSKTSCSDIEKTSTDKLFRKENTKKSHFDTKQSIPEKTIDSLRTAPMIYSKPTTENNYENQDSETVSSTRNKEQMSSTVPQVAADKSKCEGLPIEKLKTWLRTRSLRSQARWKEFLKEKEKQCEQENKKKKKKSKQLKKSRASEFCQRMTSIIIEKYEENLSGYEEAEYKLDTKQKPESTSHTKQKPESTSNLKQKPDITSRIKQKPDFTSHTKEKPDSVTNIKQKHESEEDLSKLYHFHIHLPKSNDFDEFPVDCEESQNENQNESINEEIAPSNYMNMITGFSDLKHKTKAEMIQDIMAKNEEMIKAMKSSNDLKRENPVEIEKELDFFRCWGGKGTSPQASQAQKEHSSGKYSEENNSEKASDLSGTSVKYTTALPLIKLSKSNEFLSSDFKHKSSEEKIQNIIKKNNEMMKAMKNANVLKKQCSDDIEKEMSFFRFLHENEATFETAKAQNEQSSAGCSDETKSKEKASCLDGKNKEYATALPLPRSNESCFSDSKLKTKEKRIQYIIKQNEEMMKAMKIVNILKKQSSDDIEKELSFFRFHRGDETPSQMRKKQNEAFSARNVEECKLEEKPLDLSNKESLKALNLSRKNTSESSHSEQKAKSEKIQDRLIKNVKEVKSLKKINILEKQCTKDFEKKLPYYHCQSEKKKASTTEGKSLAKEQKQSSLESCIAENKSEEIASDMTCKKEGLVEELSFSSKEEQDSSNMTKNLPKASRTSSASAALLELAASLSASLSSSLSLGPKKSSSTTCKLDLASEINSSLHTKQHSISERKETLSVLKQEEKLAVVSDESKDEEKADELPKSGDESYV